MRPAFPRLVHIWLMVGALAIVVFPELRGRHALLGWLPFWLVVAPLLSLLLWALLHGTPSPPRRRPQARRLRAGRARMRLHTA